MHTGLYKRNCRLDVLNKRQVSIVCEATGSFFVQPPIQILHGFVPCPEQKEGPTFDLEQPHCKPTMKKSKPIPSLQAKTWNCLFISYFFYFSFFEKVYIPDKAG